MTFTYELIPGGYVIYLDGQTYIYQDFDPQKPFIDGNGQPFDSEDAARADAERVIAELNAQVNG